MCDSGPDEGCLKDFRVEPDNHRTVIIYPSPCSVCLCVCPDNLELRNDSVMAALLCSLPPRALVITLQTIIQQFTLVITYTFSPPALYHYP